MKKSLYFGIILGLLLITLLSGCGGGNSGCGTGGDTVINIAAIPGVTPPAYGETPVTAITETAQYTGRVSWSPAVSGTFGATTEYTATITLTAKSGYTLTGVAANFFTIAGATSDTNSVNSGMVTAVFPATRSVPATVINIAAISGVAAPVLGVTPVTAITETAQYTGTVTWDGGWTWSSRFGGDKAYVKDLERNYEIRIRSFGHAGDGNLHVYVCKDQLADQVWRDKLTMIMDAMYQKARDLGGQVSGEHGVGHAKIGFLRESVGDTAMQLMRGVKLAFDPGNILNPGKVCMEREVPRV